MKRILFTISLLMAIVTFSFAQIDEEGGQFFGGSRAAITAFSVYDFGQINAPVSHKFNIKNTTPNQMIITEIDIPAGVSVKLTKKVIQPMDQAQLIVTIDPKDFDKKGKISLPLRITTVQNLNNGQIVKTVSTYLLKAEVQ